MPEQVCICCYDPATVEDSDPLYLRTPPETSDDQPVAWVHKDCLADYLAPFQIGDLSESDLTALREYARAANQ